MKMNKKLNPYLRNMLRVRGIMSFLKQRVKLFHMGVCLLVQTWFV